VVLSGWQERELELELALGPELAPLPELTVASPPAVARSLPVLEAPQRWVTR
jgi:hypothetical protein